LLGDGPAPRHHYPPAYEDEDEDYYYDEHYDDDNGDAGGDEADYDTGTTTQAVGDTGQIAYSALSCCAL